MEKKFNIVYEDISINCKIYCSNPINVDSIILSCHGFAGSKDNAFSKKLASDYSKLSPSTGVLVFDWPCHGDDVRQNLTLDICDKYLDVVLDYIKNKLGIDNIYAQGTSFGGYLLLKYLKEHDNPFIKIALRCPAINMYNVLTDVILLREDLEKLEKGKSVQTGFSRKIRITKEFLDSLRDYDLNGFDYSKYIDELIIMHGTNDEVVSFDYVRNFCDENMIVFYPVEGADHIYKDASKMRYCLNLVEEHFSIEKRDILTK